MRGKMLIIKVELLLSDSKLIDNDREIINVLHQGEQELLFTRAPAQATQSVFDSVCILIEDGYAPLGNKKNTI